MKVYETKDIRNIALLGHAGCGKTTLVESMLFEASIINRRGAVEEGNTISDHYEIEKERQNSVFSSLMHVAWKDSKINIIDTPGYDDFIGEVVSSLKVAGTGVMVLNAQQGVEVGTEIVWDYTKQFKTPMIFVVNQCDHEKSDFDTTVEQAKTRFGNAVTVVQYPLNEGLGFDAIIDVLKMVMYKFPTDGGKPEKHPIPEAEQERAKELHAALVEAVAEYDDDLMEAFFEKGTLDESEMARGLKMSMLHQALFPLFAVSAKQNMGSGRVMGFLHDIAPAPGDRPMELSNGEELSCDSNGEPVLFFYKTLSEPHLGEISYFKVCSGSVKTGDELYNNRRSSGERISQLNLLNGKQRDSVVELKAGDIGVTVKLKETRVNDSLVKKGSKTEIERIKFPSARIRTGIKPPSKNDIEKLAIGLAQLTKEDPTMLVNQSKELRQTIMSGQGELHLQMIKYRLEKLYNINVEFERPKIPYRETIRKAAHATYRHKKQSGGSGQFGEVHMLIEPYKEGMAPPKDLNVRKTFEHDLAWGGKLVFNNCIVGGSIDAKYMNAIQKGILLSMEEGPVIGSSVQDIRVSLYDGKMHAVDSNDMAFQIASAQAFKQGFREASPVIMEPIYDIEVLCQDAVMGDIMSDLQTRRALVIGMDSDGHYQRIKAKIPLVELYKYSSRLRSLSQGRAKHIRKPGEYQQLPMELQQQLIDSRAELADA